MVLRSFIYRLVGMFWLLVGLLITGMGLAYAFLAQSITVFLRGEFPDAVPYANEVAGRLFPGWLIAWAVLFGVLSILLGSNLAALKSWARPVAIAFHLLLAVFLAALAPVIYVILSDATVVTRVLPTDTPLIVAGVGAGLAALVGAFGISLFSDGAQRAFASIRAKSPRPAAARCPTCGSYNLNLQTGTCPQCDAEQGVVAVMAARLVDLENGERYPVQYRRRTTIGRDLLDNDVRLTDGSVSQPHAFIDFHEGRFMIYDQGSTNGTFVNDQRVRFAEIESGDELRFGRLRLRFEVDYASR